MENSYPLYYNDRGRCIRRDGPTNGFLVEIPEEGKQSPLIYSLITTGTCDRFDEMLKGFTPCTSQTYHGYLVTFYKLANASRRSGFTNPSDSNRMYLTKPKTEL